MSTNIKPRINKKKHKTRTKLCYKHEPLIYCENKNKILCSSILKCGCKCRNKIYLQYTGLCYDCLTGNILTKPILDKKTFDTFDYKSRAKIIIKNYNDDKIRFINSSMLFNRLNYDVLFNIILHLDINSIYELYCTDIIIIKYTINDHILNSKIQNYYINSMNLNIKTNYKLSNDTFNKECLRKLSKIIGYKSGRFSFKFMQTNEKNIHPYKGFIHINRSLYNLLKHKKIYYCEKCNNSNNKCIKSCNKSDNGYDNDNENDNGYDNYICHLLNLSYI